MAIGPLDARLNLIPNLQGAPPARGAAAPAGTAPSNTAFNAGVMRAKVAAAQLNSGEGLSHPSAAAAEEGQAPQPKRSLRDFIARGVMTAQGVPEGVSVARALKAKDGVQLTDGQREQVGKAAGTLSKLAGEDGLWTPGDLPNNVNQLQEGGALQDGIDKEANHKLLDAKSGASLLTYPLVATFGGLRTSGLGQYVCGDMNTARNQASSKLGQALGQAGVNSNAGQDTPLAPAKGKPGHPAPIGTAELTQFQNTMRMLETQSGQQGMPATRFPNGIPAQMLKDIAAGENPKEALRQAGAVLDWGPGPDGKPMLQPLQPKQ